MNHQNPKTKKKEKKEDGQDAHIPQMRVSNEDEKGEASD